VKHDVTRNPFTCRDQTLKPPQHSSVFIPAIPRQILQAIPYSLIDLRDYFIHAMEDPGTFPYHNISPFPFANTPYSERNPRRDPPPHTGASVDSARNRRDVLHAQCLLYTSFLSHGELAGVAMGDLDSISVVQDHESED
jgi:hypothetical protein